MLEMLNRREFVEPELNKCEESLDVITMTYGGSHRLIREKVENICDKYPNLKFCKWF